MAENSGRGKVRELSRSVFRCGLASACAKKNRQIEEMPTGHDVMLDMPERLSEILLEVA